MNHFSISIFVLLLFTVSVPTLAESERSEYSHFSRGSPALKLKERDDGGGSGRYFADFVGKVRLTGTLVVEFLREPGWTSEEDTAGEAFFLPDNRSRKKLPTAIGSFYPWPVDSIALDKKPYDLLLPLGGELSATDILHGTMQRYEIPAALIIKSFSTEVVCGHRIYVADVFSIAPLKPVVLTAAEASLIGC